MASPAFLSNFNVLVFVFMHGYKHSVLNWTIRALLKKVFLDYKFLSKNFLRLKPVQVFKKSKYIYKTLKRNIRVRKLYNFKYHKVQKILRNFKRFKHLYLFFIKNFLFIDIKMNINFKKVTIKKLSTKYYKIKVNNLFLRMFFKKKKYILNHFLFMKSYRSSLFSRLIFKFDTFSVKINQVQEYLKFYIKYRYNTKFSIRKNKIKEGIYKFLKNSKFLSKIIYLKFTQVKYKEKKRKFKKYNKVPWLLKKKKRFIRIFRRSNLPTKLLSLKKKIYTYVVFFFLNSKALHNKIVKNLSIFRRFKHKIYSTRKLFNRKKSSKKYYKGKLFKKRWKKLLRNYLGILRHSLKIPTVSLIKFNILTPAIVYSLKKTQFSCNSRVFLNKKKIYKNIINFYYKSLKKINKNKPKNWKLNLRHKNIFLDCNISLLGKLRGARQAHWSLFKIGKLNRRRYRNFLKLSIKYVFKETDQDILIFIFFQLFKRVISWNHVKWLLKSHLFLINGLNVSNKVFLKQGDLIETSVSLVDTFFYNWYKSHYKKYNTRIKKWSYVNYCRRSNPNLKKQKNIPKIIKKLPISFRFYNQIMVVDYSNNIASILPLSQDKREQLIKKIYTSTIIKLYGWRYNP